MNQTTTLDTTPGVAPAMAPASASDTSLNAAFDTGPTRVDVSKIPGWGVDADPENDPTYPYRDRSQEDHSGEWARPPIQNVDVEVLQSIEHKQRPAVVGTSTPPSGLSGMLRRIAYTKSESNLLHWMLLLGADRLNMVEADIQDLGRGKVPNIPGEMGMRAGWEHNKSGLLMKGAATVAVAALATAAWRRRHT
jgi:hypothetical protein